jgi:hypothetical protein
VPESPRHRLVARVVAALSAVVWGLLDFGLIDLVTAVFRNPVFAQHYMLEVGWGLLYLVLVAGPCLALVVRPSAGLWHWQLWLVALSLALAGCVARQPGHLVPAAAIASTAALLWWLGGARRPPTRWEPSAPVWVAAAGVLPWIWYAVRMARSTFNDEITNGLTHYPAQGALGLALVLGAVLVAGTPVGSSGRRLHALFVGGSGLTLGAESVVNPDLVGTLGTVGGVAAVVWSVALVAAVLVPERARQPALQES